MRELLEVKTKILKVAQKDTMKTVTKFSVVCTEEYEGLVLLGHANSTKTKLLKMTDTRS